jgi:phage terminase large subunit-like protein
MSPVRPKKIPSSPSSTPPSAKGRARRKPNTPWPIKLPSDKQCLDEGCYFDPDAADRVITFIESFCKHSAGRFAGQPFLLEPWQRDFLRTLYGWKRADGHRRFREAYLEVPKKNGKSTLLAGMALFALFEEPGAEVYIGAVDRSQASIIFDECARMVRASPALSKHLVVIDSKKRIIFPARNAKLVAMSADAPNKDGVNASMVILDELHRFPSPALYDVMKFAGAARDQPLMVSITTAGHDRKTICYEQHERALSAIAGTAEGGDPEFLPVIYAADPDKDDLDDPKTWRKANPSMGQVLKEEDFRKAHKEAKLLPRLWAAFLRLRLNIWTEQVTRWIPIEKWDALAEDSSKWELQGAECYVALDLSSTTDLTALALLFPLEDGDFLSKVFYFVPEETAAKRARHDKQPYPLWIKQGHMVGTEGDATDHDAVRKFLNDLAEKHTILKVGIDPWNAQQLANQLMQDGFEVEFIRQGYSSLSGPSKDFERMVLAHSIHHDSNPVTKWCVGNVSLEQDAAGNIKPSKKRSPERIDGAVALVMTIALAMAEPGYQAPSITILRRGSKSHENGPEVGEPEAEDPLG